MAYAVGDRVRYRTNGPRRELRNHEGVICVVGTPMLVQFDDTDGNDYIYDTYLELVAPTVSPDLVDRMVRLVRDLAGPRPRISALDASNEAAVIAPLLPPEPVDPLVLRAREICDRHTSGPDMGFYRSGDADDKPMMQAVLTALRDRP